MLQLIQQIATNPDANESWLMEADCNVFDRYMVASPSKDDTTLSAFAVVPLPGARRAEDDTDDATYPWLDNDGSKNDDDDATDDATAADVLSDPKTAFVWPLLPDALAVNTRLSSSCNNHN
jgi:hypothetical protein